MSKFKIGKCEIVDHNRNDRYDPLFDETKKCGFPGGRYDDSIRFIADLEGYGLDVSKLSTYSLAKTSEAARLMDEAAQRPLQANVALLRGKARAAGLDEGKYLNRLNKFLETAFGVARYEAWRYSGSGEPGKVSIALDQAGVCAEKGIELGLKLAISAEESGYLIENARANDIERRLGDMERSVMRGKYNESDFELNLKILDAYEEKGQLTANTEEDPTIAVLDPIQERRWLLHNYAYYAKRPFHFVEKQLLGDYIKLRRDLRQVQDFENAHRLLSAIEDVATRLESAGYYRAPGLVLTHLTGPHVSQTTLTRILKERFWEIASYISLPADKLQSRFDELEAQATEAGLEFDGKTAAYLVYQSGLTQLRSFFHNAEVAARSKDADRVQEKLHEAWEYASEINVDFDTDREAEILDILQNGPTPEDEQMIRPISLFFFGNSGWQGIQMDTHTPGFHGIGLYFDK